MENYFMKKTVANSDTLIIIFTGHPRVISKAIRYDFFNTIENHFNHVNRHYYVDKYENSYHQGIEGLSVNIDETVSYLQNEIKPYKNIVFIGVSSGGYAAILFGSLLNITSVIAFIPQTIRIKKNIDEKYRDISPYINKTTKYYIYGDTKISDKLNPHHIHHCDRISHHSNVFITKKHGMDIGNMRDDGELIRILQNVGL